MSDLRQSIVRRVPGRRRDAGRAARGREWLVTNGLGGYASGTVAGVVTRRYHGLLIAALPEPLGRMVMLNMLAEAIVLGDGRRVQLGAEETHRTRAAACRESRISRNSGSSRAARLELSTSAAPCSKSAC